MRDDRERLLDIQDAVARIERYAARGRAAFDGDELIQAWIVRHLQIIGEASRGLTAPFRHSHPEVPWTNIIGMRNILVHGYFEIDLDVVWSVVENDLPDLKAKIQALLASLPAPP